MSTHGFEYTPMGHDANLSAARAADSARAAGFPLSGGATSYASSGTDLDPSVDPNIAYVRSLNRSGREAYTIAMFGLGDEVVELEILGGSVGMTGDGCLADARRSLFGDLRRYLAGSFFEANSAALAHNAAFTDASVAVSGEAWAVCMAGFGFQFVNFRDAAEYAAVHPMEATELLGADRECTASSGLRSAYMAAFDSKILELRQQTADLTDGYDESVAEAVKRAIANLEARKG